MISPVASLLQSQTPSSLVQFMLLNSRCCKHVSNKVAVLMNNCVFSEGVSELNGTNKRIFAKTRALLGKHWSKGVILDWLQFDAGSSAITVCLSMLELVLRFGWITFKEKIVV